MGKAQEGSKRKTTTPSDGYVCRVCNLSGHWIQQCPDGPKARKRKKSVHVAVEGVDPSEKDIDEARRMQKLTPPNCFCGDRTRLAKVTHSNVNPLSR